MTDSIHREVNRQKKLSLFDYAMEVIGWLQIVASPLVGGLIVGGIVYWIIGDPPGLIAGTIISITALVLGIVFGNRVWKKRGTMNFMSRVNASPEIDNSESVEDQEKQHTTEASQNGS